MNGERKLTRHLCRKFRATLDPERMEVLERIEAEALRLGARFGVTKETAYTSADNAQLWLIDHDDPEISEAIRETKRERGRRGGVQSGRVRRAAKRRRNRNIVRLYLSGVPTDRCAARFRVSESTVIRAVRAVGLQRAHGGARHGSGDVQAGNVTDPGPAAWAALRAMLHPSADQESRSVPSRETGPVGPALSLSHETCLAARRDSDSHESTTGGGCTYRTGPPFGRENARQAPDSPESAATVAADLVSRFGSEDAAILASLQRRIRQARQSW